MHSFDAPSFWSSLLNWLIPPAQAKGSEPSARVTAWLSDDRTRLFATGETSDAWRDEKSILHTKHDPLGLLVIDTDTLQLVETLELLVNRGLSTEKAVALTGSRSAHIWCDEVCRPGNNEPEVEGESEHSGLLLLHPTNLGLIAHQPGVHLDRISTVDGWLLVERYENEKLAVETIDLATGTVTPSTSMPSGVYVLTTDLGVFTVETFN